MRLGFAVRRGGAKVAKRKKVRQAGDLVEAVIYTPPEPHDGFRERRAKSRMTAEAVRAMNDRSARRKLEFYIAGNFCPEDLFLTLTYRDGDLPQNRAEARKKLGKFFRALREHRRRQGAELKYIYVTENKHGAGRFHHHIVINSTERDIEAVRSLWAYGDVCDIEYIGSREAEDWAGYMTKEGVEGRPVGAQLWTASRNLKKPVERSTFVPNDETLTLPPGAGLLAEKCGGERDASYKYIKYRLPPRRAGGGRDRKGRGRSAGEVPLLSDLNEPITLEQGRRKWE